jgi:PAS domain S-box-containing protein
MTPRTRASRLFISAMVLLGISGIGSNLAFHYFRLSERWVSHTYEVRAALGDFEALMNAAARARTSYLISGSPSSLADYRKAVAAIPYQLRGLKDLTNDNPNQSGNLAEMDASTGNRLRQWEDAIDRKQRNEPTDLSSLLDQNLLLGAESAAVDSRIRAEENRLLNLRIRRAQQNFDLAAITVVSSLIVAVLLLFFQYSFLTNELRARVAAEQAALAAYEREAALRQEQTRFRLFVDAVKDYVIYVLDSEGRVATWNQGAERIKGYKTWEIVGRSFSCFFTPEDILAGKPALELEIATREGKFEGEAWRVRRDGTKFWANTLLTAIKDDHDKLVGFVTVTRDVTERMRAQESLAQVNTQLAGQVAQRQSAEKRLAFSEQSLRQLSLHLLRTQDEERRRIGRELHDSLGQYLAVLKMQLEALRSGMSDNPNGAGQQIVQCIRLADDSIKEMRTISYLLYPPMLEEIGLKSAIPWYLEGFTERSNIKTRFEADADFGRPGRDVELALFRVLQESLTNVHRHSGSATVEIRLWRTPDHAVMKIADQGKGIPKALLEEAGNDWLGSLGVGLRGMNERIRQLGGNLQVSSTEKGTVVTATVPVEQSALSA